MGEIAEEVEQAPRGVQEEGCGADTAEHVPEDPKSHVLASLQRLEATVAREVAGLRQAFDDRLAYDRTKEEQITRLHDEVQEHRRDLLARAKRPLLSGLVRLHDDLWKVVEALELAPTEKLTPEKLFATLAGFADDLELLLGQHGVETFRLPGDDFDPHRQTALRTEVTEEAERAGTVAARLRPGFAEGETVLVKERVAVYVAARRPPGERTREVQTGSRTEEENR